MRAFVTKAGCALVVAAALSVLHLGYCANVAVAPSSKNYGDSGGEERTRRNLGVSQTKNQCVKNGRWYRSYESNNKDWSCRGCKCCSKHCNKNQTRGKEGHRFETCHCGKNTTAANTTCFSGGQMSPGDGKSCCSGICAGVALSESGQPLCLCSYDCVVAGSDYYISPNATDRVGSKCCSGQCSQHAKTPGVDGYWCICAGGAEGQCLAAGKKCKIAKNATAPYGGNCCSNQCSKQKGGEFCVCDTVQVTERPCVADRDQYHVEEQDTEGGGLRCCSGQCSGVWTITPGDGYWCVCGKH